jgi:integrase
VVRCQRPCDDTFHRLGATNDVVGQAWVPLWLVPRGGGGADRLHGLRHTSATIAIDAGVGIHVLSERLGHASTSITSDIYVDALARQHTDAAERIGGVLSGTKEGSR